MMNWPKPTLPPTIPTLHCPNWELDCQDVAHKQRLFDLAESVGVPVDKACRDDDRLIVTMRYRGNVMTLVTDSEHSFLYLHRITEAQLRLMAASYPNYTFAFTDEYRKRAHRYAC
jgi:hypothetical protein